MITKASPKVRWTKRNTVFKDWFERDRAYVILETMNGRSIVELWDDEVVEHGRHEKPWRMTWNDYLLETANDLQLLPEKRQ